MRLNDHGVGFLEVMGIIYVTMLGLSFLARIVVGPATKTGGEFIRVESHGVYASTQTINLTQYREDDGRKAER